MRFIQGNRLNPVNNSRAVTYWELQKFLIMALKANPNILECLYTPIVEYATPLAQELLDMRALFLSRMVYQTYNGYVMSQFKRMQADIRNHGEVKWKHVMHLIRLLLSGIHVLREGFVQVDTGEHRDRLLAIKNNEMPWDEVEAWRLDLHAQFDRALEETKLPERPDYELANEFLVKARRLAVAEELSPALSSLVLAGSFSMMSCWNLRCWSGCARLCRLPVFGTSSARPGPCSIAN